MPFLNSKRATLAFVLVAGTAAFPACGRNYEDAKQIDSVDNAMSWTEQKHRVDVESFDDPTVSGITVYISKDVSNGIVGFGEYTSHVSIAVSQTGPIVVNKPFQNGDEVFSEKRSSLFKQMKIVRFWDKNHNTFLYAVVEGRFLDGSPKHSLSAVVAKPWRGVEPILTPTVKSQPEPSEG